MQPLLRHILRPSVSSTLGKGIQRPGSRRLQQQWLDSSRPSVCLQCQFRTPSRPYSDIKPTPPQDDRSGRTISSTGTDDIIDKSTHPASAESGQSGEPIKPLFSKKSPEELPSQEENRRWGVSKRFTSLMDNLQSNIFIAGQRLNDLTGYSGIEALKRQIDEQEEEVRRTRTALREAKEAFTAAITKRSASQREVNELLQRKHAWSPQDLERFTTLYRSDHENEQEELAAQEALAAAERRAEEASAMLSKTILARYHEEQIWSDKIRRMSTWGTWGLMGVNVLLFVVFQIAVEPWRRRRLVSGFEEKVREAIEREAAGLHQQAPVAMLAADSNGAQGSPGELSPAESKAVQTEPPSTETVPESVTVSSTRSPDVAEEPEPMTGPASDASISPSSSIPAALFSRSYRQAVRDLFSDTSVTLRKVDLTTIALQSAGLGAAFAGLLALLLRRN